MSSGPTPFHDCTRCRSPTWETCRRSRSQPWSLWNAIHPTAKLWRVHPGETQPTGWGSSPECAQLLLCHLLPAAVVFSLFWRGVIPGWGNPTASCTVWWSEGKSHSSLGKFPAADHNEGSFYKSNDAELHQWLKWTSWVGLKDTGSEDS